METHKRRFVTSSTSEEDIISNLSEDLINPILDRLPIEDAVRTSVLSKKWRYRWTTMRVLNFSLKFSEKLSKNVAFSHNGFIRVINKIMIYHNGPIFKFVLHIPKEINLDSFQEVDQWMLILSRNSVKNLSIISLDQIYPIPSFVFSCLELRVLTLCNCIFKPPLEFHGFPNLENIYLILVNFGGNLGGTVINLPQLESLTLYGCASVNNFNIKAEKLQTLHVDSCPEAMLIQLLHSQHLSAVKICLPESLNDFLRVETFIFTIDGHFLKIFAAEKLLPLAIKWIKQLNFHRFSFGWINFKGPEADMRLTSNYLESHDHLDQTMFMLKTVEMTSLEGSRPELLFVKLLLDHSPHLENMIIRPTATADAQKRLNIAKEVMLFPRASTKAKMVYVNPVP